jgi:hypothetical protein
VVFFDEERIGAEVFFKGVKEGCTRRERLFRLAVRSLENNIVWSLRDWFRLVNDRSVPQGVLKFSTNGLCILCFSTIMYCLLATHSSVFSSSGPVNVNLFPDPDTESDRKNIEMIPNDVAWLPYCLRYRHRSKALVVYKKTTSPLPEVPQPSRSSRSSHPQNDAVQHPPPGLVSGIPPLRLVAQPKVTAAPRTRGCSLGWSRCRGESFSGTFWRVFDEGAPRVRGGYGYSLLKRH